MVIYEVQFDGESVRVEANSHGDAIARAIVEQRPQWAVKVCELIEGAQKNWRPALAQVVESVQIDWCLAPSGALSAAKCNHYARAFVPLQVEQEQLPVGSCQGAAIVSFDKVLFDNFQAKLEAFRSKMQEEIVEKVREELAKKSDDNHASVASQSNRIMRLMQRRKLAEQLAIEHPEWSDRQIARASGISPTTVGAIRRLPGRKRPSSTKNRRSVESPVMQMAVSMMTEDGQRVGPPPVSQEEIDKMNASEFIPNSKAVHYNPIADECIAAFYVHEGHAYRLATVYDLEATVWFSDTGFDSAIAGKPGELIGYSINPDEQFIVEADEESLRWKYAFVQDDSLLK